MSGTHSSVLAWRIPGTGEPGALLSMGSHRVGHDWSDLAAAAAGHEWGFPGGTSGKEPACKCRRHKSEKVKVSQLCPTLWDPSPGQNTGGVAFPFSWGSSQPRDQTQVFRIADGFFINWSTRGAQEYWTGWPISLLQCIFWTQESNWDLLHCRWILYQLSGQPMGSIPGSGRFPGWACGNPLQYSCLENLTDRGAWWAAVHGAANRHNWSDLSGMHAGHEWHPG